MRLSILIPTYNTSCLSLVRELHSKLPADCEILVGDDGSNNADIRTENRRIEAMRGVTYWESAENLGRARIRNRLAEMAHGEYLLFIDSDAQVQRTDFVEKYLQCLPTLAVVCGGTLHPDTLPSPMVSLRWRYEKSCEPRFTTERRNEHPYQSLSTFNILIPKSVALAHPFDENIRQYGYEDTLLGRILEEADIKVYHIDNPLIHLGLDDNKHFLQKTEEAMRTLYDLGEKMDGLSNLLNIYRKLQRLHLIGLVRITYSISRPLLRRNLLGSRPSVRLFNFYKLGYYASL